jgi:hypothetical protein
MGPIASDKEVAHMPERQSQKRVNAPDSPAPKLDMSGCEPREPNRWITRAIWSFVALGMLMRVLRLLLRFPLWGDEAALAANLIDRGFLDLLRPLDYQQVAPPLFLWIELWVVQRLNFDEWSLRAFPFLCSLGSLLLFRHVATRILNGIFLKGCATAGWAQLLAVAIFSVSYYPLRHGVEVKQYASDLFVSLVLFTLALEFLSDFRRVHGIWCLAVVGPIALGLSHPAAFVAGGISLALLPVVWRCRTIRTCIPFLAYNLALLVAFACLYMISTGPQIAAATDEGIMRSYWAQSFPPVMRPVQLVIWFFAIHTGQLFAYPAGGADLGSGLLTLACFVTGTIALIRCGSRSVVILCLGPFVLTFIAAAMQCYPYGGYARTSQHLAPLICLLAGAGAARFLDRLRQDGVRRRVQMASLAALAGFGASLMLRDVTCPYRTEHDRRVREFARWFWHDKAIDAELICARTDLREPFFRQSYLWRGIAQYLCNQRIYSPRLRGTDGQPHWDAISVKHPLRCVVFSRPGLSRDETAFAAWLDGIQAHFTWVGYERNDFYKPHDHGLDIERIEVYEFVPRADAQSQAASSPPLPVRRSINPMSN